MEFKRLSDVEVVAEPTESANVLIEENGVIKKAPKTAVGGAGGSDTPDMVIGVTQHSANSIEVNNDNASIIEGSMDAVFEAIRSGRTPIVKIRYMSPDLSGYTAMVNEFQAYVYTYGEALWLKYIATTYASAGWYGCYLSIQDGTWAFTSNAL
jgi:hypothetical protein